MTKLKSSIIKLVGRMLVHVAEFVQWSEKGFLVNKVVPPIGVGLKLDTSFLIDGVVTR